VQGGQDVGDLTVTIVLQNAGPVHHPRPVHELPTAVSSEDEADSLQRAACSHPPAVARQDTVLVLVEVKKQIHSLLKQAREAARLQYR
jgi:hypothetical protein